jgi:hypothetical protein
MKKNGTGAEKQDELIGFLESKGFKPTSPDFAQKTKMQRTQFKMSTLTKLAGIATLCTILWTVTYDQISMGVLEAKREHFITDTITGEEFVTATVVFLTTTGGATWTFDGTWNNANNSIEAIGTGSTGRNGGGAPFNFGCSGGGGGAYAAVTNQTISTNKSYTIPAAGANPANVTWDTTVVVADSGNQSGACATASTGGLASNSTGTTKFNGGSCATPTGSNAGTGGGGAAGPAGAGGTSVTQTGGTGNNGGTPANTAGTHYGGTHGAGGGGTGGSGNGVAGVSGKLYGAGGGGGGGAGAAGGAGAQGLIVLTWIPAGGARSHQWFM